jgi:antitoxin ChpS
MYKTNLRKVGGSVMLAVPPALLDILNLAPGTEVGIGVQGKRLVVEPRQRPRYSLTELLAQCHPKSKRGRKERQWTTDKALGRELI